LLEPQWLCENTESLCPTSLLPDLDFNSFSTLATMIKFGGKIGSKTNAVGFTDSTFLPHHTAYETSKTLLGSFLTP
jgi:hypothetical protein